MTTTDTRRTPLTRQRVIEGAVALADEVGIHPLTIRALAERLGVKPMALYHHVAGKEQIIDGMVDHVFAEIALPPEGMEWRAALRVRSRSARDVLARHPWAAPLMETRFGRLVAVSWAARSSCRPRPAHAPRPAGLRCRARCG